MNHLGYLVLIAAIGVVFLVVWSIYQQKAMKQEPLYQVGDVLFYADVLGFHVGKVARSFYIHDLQTGVEGFYYTFAGVNAQFYQGELFTSLTQMQKVFEKQFAEAYPDYAPVEVEVNRSSITGRFETDEATKANPDTTVTETIKREYL